MKKFKLLLSSFFILALGINGNSNEKKHEELRCHFETNFTYESFYGIPSSQVVYVCIGPYAYAYHSRSDCPGLGNCKGEIRYTCLLYTSDAADDLLCVDLGGCRIIKKKNKK